MGTRLFFVALAVSASMTTACREIVMEHPDTAPLGSATLPISANPNTPPAPSAPTSPLPPGQNQWIASQHPGDVGIENHPDVVFTENFEYSALSQVFSRWTNIKNGSGMALETDTPPGSSGQRSIRMLRNGGSNTGGHLWKRLDRVGLASNDVLFMRYYIKLSTYGAHHHTGGGMEGVTHNENWPIGMAGIRPTGDDRFSVRVEAFNDGRDRVDFYTYWMGMHKNPSVSDYYGNMFVHNYAIRHQRNGWTCIEFMLKLNNPVGAANGELRLWVNDQEASHLYQGNPIGKWLNDEFLPLGSDGYAYKEQTYPWPMSQVSLAPFEGFQWRRSEALRLNAISLDYYATRPYVGTQADPERVWYDDMVVAKSRIGCLQPQ